jgi:hypothetical protein
VPCITLIIVKYVEEEEEEEEEEKKKKKKKKIDFLLVRLKVNKNSFFHICDKYVYDNIHMNYV